MSEAPIEIPAGERFLMPWRFYQRRFWQYLELILAVALLFVLPLDGQILRWLSFSIVVIVLLEQSPVYLRIGEFMNARLVVWSHDGLCIVHRSSVTEIPLRDITEVDVRRTLLFPDVLRVKTQNTTLHLPILGASGERLVQLVKDATPVNAHTLRAKKWAYSHRRGLLVAPSVDGWDQVVNVLAKERA